MRFSITIRRGSDKFNHLTIHQSKILNLKSQILPFLRLSLSPSLPPLLMVSIYHFDGIGNWYHLVVILFQLILNQIILLIKKMSL